jgi:hypothetical protein
MMPSDQLGVWGIVKLAKTIWWEDLAVQMEMIWLDRNEGISL